ncbi:MULTISPECIES: LysE family translocator [Hyphobacterium]|uniref:LysE family translocator n=1 Tax=Hyphobacterium vulgare TaxID=1736751 RepID=A0ABV6ZXI8_9PROT
MPDLSGLFGFALAVLVIEVTPGPNMAWIAVLSAGSGRKAGLSAVAGIALGLLVIGAAAGLGLAALITAAPALYEVLRWGGALFLLYLAWEGWREAGESSPAKLPDGSLKHFSRGFLINALNPKAALFYVAVLPEFIDPARSLPLQAAALTVLSVIIATMIHTAIVFAAAQAQSLVSDRRRLMILRRILSALLVLIAVWLFFETARPAA